MPAKIRKVMEVPTEGMVMKVGTKVPMMEPMVLDAFKRPTVLALSSRLDMVYLTRHGVVVPSRKSGKTKMTMQQTKAAYKLRTDGKIEVLNTGIKNGKPKESKGKAKTTATTGLLRVSFFGPFYSDYRILLVDKDYQYALIGSSSDSYLWILSRKPQLTNKVRQLILKEAQRRGYDTGKLIWVKHN